MKPGATTRNHGALAISRLWREGDWQALADLRLADIAPLEERAELALLVASAHFHNCDLLATGTWLHQARDWGADSALADRILIAGLTNTVGRIATIIGRSAQAEAAFTASLEDIISPDRMDDAAFVRKTSEMIRLGLLPEALGLLREGIETELEKREGREARLTILESGLEQANHALSLALARNQLGPGPGPATRDSDPAAYARAHSVAQLGQDVWVLESTGFKTGGYFVEFGATNGIVLSNSYLLEKGFGWNGICAEPNPDYFEQLQRNRDCIVSQDCIAAETGKTIEFVMAGVLGGILEHAGHDMHEAKRQAHLDRQHVVELTTISLDDFLKKHNAPKTIDYLSIDTEGSEYEILSAFPFDKWDIRLLTVEHNFTPVRDDIHALLSKQGYRRIEAQWDDWYILDLPVQQPPKAPGKRGTKSATRK